MKKIFLVLLATTAMSSQALADQFSQFACENLSLNQPAPRLFDKVQFPEVGMAVLALGCQTKLTFSNGLTALVERDVVTDQGENQKQLLVVSLQTQQINPILASSRYLRARFTDGHPIGPDRGGTPLPPSLDQIEVLKTRSLGLSNVGLETFDVGFSYTRTYRRSANGREITDETKFRSEFDLCGNRLDRRYMSAILSNIKNCSHYTATELREFEEFHNL
ncbi:MAG: hypothetical protein H6624_06445 [Bdellovibrionaceae bacterium]|nr:hypothetical protein [Bdellovibrionales bacterium]MCB9083963.1 hypothetical protein [Pseudobdellovibrionaceae bacterium]